MEGLPPAGCPIEKSRGTRGHLWRRTKLRQSESEFDVSNFQHYFFSETKKRKIVRSGGRLLGAAQGSAGTGPAAIPDGNLIRDADIFVPRRDCIDRSMLTEVASGRYEQGPKTNKTSSTTSQRQCLIDLRPTRALGKFTTENVAIAVRRDQGKAKRKRDTLEWLVYRADMCWPYWDELLDIV
ncbi:hypothetical protein WN51_13840 [Melipona quadrifasciata]|uniref:Uncharacterized protein n=1 Tax=Melipona quadrifasciata TaxID=166423 RepID=A0A0N0BFS5_9HYME|nr:hypothetical protein WN51_13840 [Melipona quadrifasciata]